MTCILGFGAKPVHDSLQRSACVQCAQLVKATRQSAHVLLLLTTGIDRDSSLDFRGNKNLSTTVKALN